ncbi:MAG: DNA recombination protein RmuC [Rhabdochlamydiaceae bacterium]|nr:DNA recombination protein RmuC [Candidatus Amphrikana amoebophyrae]
MILIILGLICIALLVLYYRARLKMHQLEIDNSRLQVSLDEKIAAFENEKKLYQKSEQELKESFQSLSFDALQKNNQSFLDLAKKSFDQLHEQSKGNLTQKEEAIKHLVQPMKESLGKLDEHLHSIQKERKVDTTTLSEQIKLLMESESKLREETSGLIKVLKAPNVRGKWGEVQLKRIVELAGMLGHCDFIEQKTLEEDGEIQRPDMVIQMPGDCCIAIDSKAPFDAFLEATNEQDEEKREKKLLLHSKQLRFHILALGKKSYYKHFKRSPEFVVLFLPNESFYTAALTADPSLLELGAEKGVIIATPSTLIGLLKAVAFGWKQDQLSKNAEEVSKLGHELYKRLSDMNKHMMQLGRNIKSATQSYNKTVGSFESRVLVSARKFKELGAATHEIDLERPESLETIPKELSVKGELEPEPQEVV